MKLNKLFIKIGFNTIVQIGGKAMNILLGILTVGLLTRSLGVGKYGNFTLVFTYLSFFSVLSDFGMQLAVVKELAGEKEKIEIIAGTYFWLKLLTVVLSNILALVCLFFFPYSQELKIGIVIGSFAVSVSGMTTYFNALFQSKIRLDLITLTDVVTKIFTVLSIILIIVIKGNFYLLVSSVLIGNLIGIALSYFFLKEVLNIRYDMSIAKRIIMISFPIGITSFFSTLYFKVDSIILSLFKDSVQVGIYSLAYKLLENILLFWGFYMASVYPLLAKFKMQGENNYRHLLTRSSWIALVTSMPIMLIAYILSPYLIDIFGGKKFMGSIMSFNILIFSIPLLLLNNIFYSYYVIEGKNFIVMIAMVTTLIINVVLNILYIPQYGYIAASYITVISALILLILYFAGFKYTWYYEKK